MTADGTWGSPGKLRRLAESPDSEFPDSVFLICQFFMLVSQYLPTLDVFKQNQVAKSGGRTF